MKTTKQAKAEVGVIVARFQVHRLHEAHLELIKDVVQTHPRTIIFLGLSPAIGTQNNPLDFEARKKMILNKFPGVTVLYIKDVADDKVWSEHLDVQINNMIGPMQEPMLYGGRESFISRYHGEFPTTELQSSKYISGTEMRKTISASVKESEDFRAGVIWATHNRYPQSVPTIDVIIRNEEGKYLLVRKHNESKFRFVGGFSQPDDDSYELTARREIAEEVGVETDDMKYIGSCNIDDWRYRDEVDKIKTIIFEAKYIYGVPIPKDTAEIAEARWTTLDDDTISISNVLVPEHVRVYEIYKSKIS